MIRGPPRLRSSGISRWEGSATSGAFFFIFYSIGFDGGTSKLGTTRTGSSPSVVGNRGRGRTRSRCSRDGGARDLSALLALLASLPPLAAPDTALRGPGIGVRGGHDLDIQGPRRRGTGAPGLRTPLVGCAGISRVYAGRGGRVVLRGVSFGMGRGTFHRLAAHRAFPAPARSLLKLLQPTKAWGHNRAPLRRHRGDRGAYALRDSLGLNLPVSVRLLCRSALLPAVAAGVGVALRCTAVLACGPILLAEDQTCNPRGATPHRLRKRGGRGEPIQRRAGAGLQPTGERGLPLSSGKRGELRRRDGRDPSQRPVLTPHQPHRASRYCRGDRRGNLGAFPRPPHDRWLARLPDLSQAAVHTDPWPKQLAQHALRGHGWGRKGHGVFRPEAFGNRTGRRLGIEPPSWPRRVRLGAV